MKVLITNFRLADHTGTEVVVRDLSVEIQRRGHTPLVYSPKLGAIAQEIREYGVEVTNDLRQLSTVPDVIHGQHHAQVVEALLHFPAVPVIYVCHDAKAPIDEPFYFPRIFRYIAVDERCKARFDKHPEIPPDRTAIIYNAVNLDKFVSRQPLPAKPKRALIFSNAADHRTHVHPVRSACQHMNVEVEVVGSASGTANPRPETILPLYDLVFAKARCALEAMATGAAVILCDFAGAGPMVTSANFDSLRPNNFGWATLTNPHEVGYLKAEIARYDPVDAALVSRRVRAEAGLFAAVGQWLDVYSEVIEEFRLAPPESKAEFAALAKYLETWSYGNRVEWEREQLRKIQHLPLVGTPLFGFILRKLRTFTK